MNSSHPRWTKVEHSWLAAIGLLLTVTAALKLHAGFIDSRELPASEAVFGIPMKQWSIGAGLSELLVVLMLIVAPRPITAFRVIRVFFAAVLTYRVLLHLYGGGYCACLGRLLAESPLQAKEGLLLGGLALAIFIVNEWLFWMRRFRTRACGESPWRKVNAHAVPDESLEEGRKM